MPEEKSHEHTQHHEHEHHHEHKEHHTEHKGSEGITLKKSDAWKIATALAVLLLIISIFTGGFRGNKEGITGVVSADKAAQSALNYISNNLLQPGTSAALKNVSESSGVYSIGISIGDQDYTSYITKDGKLLFAGGIDMAQEAEKPTAQSETPQQPQKLNIDVDDGPVLGNKNAPVTIVEFSDFQCPYCGRFFTQTLPSIKKDYIDTGKVKLVFRDFPLSFHPNAEPAAEAAECANEQGKYWEYHDKLFENQDSLSSELYIKLAGDLGLDVDKFKTCIETSKYKQEVEDDFNYGQSVGVSGTPTFFINGIKLVGAQPYEAFKQIIDAELAK